MLMASPGVQKMDFWSDWRAVLVSVKSTKEAVKESSLPPVVFSSVPSSKCEHDPANNIDKAVK